MENIICLDTNILVHFLRGRDEEAKFIQEFEEHGRITTTIITMFELYFGAYLTGKEENVHQVEELEKRMEILPLKKDTVKIAGKILAELQKKGEDIEFRDLFIGCIAREEHIPLKTYNIKHFKNIPGIALA